MSSSLVINHKTGQVCLYHIDISATHYVTRRTVPHVPALAVYIAFGLYGPIRVLFFNRELWIADHYLHDLRALSGICIVYHRTWYSIIELDTLFHSDDLYNTLLQCQCDISMKYQMFIMESTFWVRVGCRTFWHIQARQTLGIQAKLSMPDLCPSTYLFMLNVYVITPYRKRLMWVTSATY